MPEVLFCIPGAVPIETIAAVNSAIAGLRAPRHAALHREHPVPADGANELEKGALKLVETLLGNGDFRRATHPADVGGLRLRLYEAGIEGDDAVPALGGMRDDISVVVNLNDETEYEGGDVIVDMGGFENRWRGAKGDCIVYPADATRQVSMVKAGRRLLFTFEVQSYVRDASRRQVLLDFSSVLSSLDERGSGKPAAVLLRRCHEDLLRHWAESGLPRRREG